MKSIKFYIVENNDNPNKIFFETNRNSLFIFENEKHYFDSHYNAKEEVEVFWVPIIFNEELARELAKFIEPALINAGKMSEEPIEWDENKILLLEAPIYSEITKCMYEEPKSIFEFIGSIFIKSIMGHKLINGNKRFSLAFLILILRYFGYHLMWSKGEQKNHSFHKVKIEKFVKILEIDYNEGVKKVIEWISNSCVIAIKF
ncbi:MAG: type II toxin-antitoxin system death-on-curing family toxin [Mycoplasmataceae bacterium]|nr:type II toxin-antitoxin system death-on-curing family toxin [Mycoplasmataceae bacterium]